MICDAVGETGWWLVWQPRRRSSGIWLLTRCCCMSATCAAARQSLHQPEHSCCLDINMDRYIVVVCEPKSQASDKLSPVLY